MPTGYAKASGLPNSSVVVANGATVNLPSASTSYSNAKQFKVIVLVCQKSDDSLYSSKVASTLTGAGSRQLADVASRGSRRD